jgi:imidazoleglycerol-phosphate dehydratase
MTRTAEITRNTSETQIRVALNLDGTGRQKLNTCSTRSRAMA